MRNNKKNGFIQVLPLILLAAFAVTTLVIANRVQTQEQEIRSQAAGGTCVGTPPANCKVSGFTISGCGGREESNCKAVAACGCSWSLSTTTTTTTTCSGIRPTCATGYALKCKAPNYICERTAPLPSGTAPKPVITSVAPKPVTTEAPKPVTTAPVITSTQYYRLNTTTRTCDKVAFSSTALTLAECNKRLAALPVSPVTTTVKIKSGVKCTNASGCLCDIPNQLLFVANGQTCPVPTATPATTTQPTTRYYYDLTQKKCVEDKNGVSLTECKAEAATYYYVEVYTNCLKSAPKSSCDADLKTFRFNTSDPNNPKCDPYVYGALSKEECQRKLTDYQTKQGEGNIVLIWRSASKTWSCESGGAVAGPNDYLFPTSGLSLSKCKEDAVSLAADLPNGPPVISTEKLPDNALCFPTGGISRCNQCSSSNKYLANDGLHCAPRGLSSPACNTLGAGNCITGQAYRCIANVGGSWELRRDDSCLQAAGAAATCTFTDTKIVEDGKIVCSNGKNYDCCGVCKNGINRSGTYPRCYGSEKKYSFDEKIIDCAEDVNGTLTQSACEEKKTAALRQKAAGIAQGVVDRTRQCIFNQCGSYTICPKALFPCLGFTAPALKYGKEVQIEGGGTDWSCEVPFEGGRFSTKEECTRFRDEQRNQSRCPFGTAKVVAEAIKGGGGVCAGDSYDCCSLCPPGARRTQQAGFTSCFPLPPPAETPQKAAACAGRKPGSCNANNKVCNVVGGVLVESTDSCTPLFNGNRCHLGSYLIGSFWLTCDWCPQGLSHWSGGMTYCGPEPMGQGAQTPAVTLKNGDICRYQTNMQDAGSPSCDSCPQGLSHWEAGVIGGHQFCGPESVPESKQDISGGYNAGCCGNSNECPSRTKCTEYPAGKGSCKSGKSCQFITECSANTFTLGYCDPSGRLCQLTGISNAQTYAFSAPNHPSCPQGTTVVTPASATYVMIFNQNSKTYFCEASAMSGAVDLGKCQQAAAQENAKLIAARTAPALTQATQQLASTVCKLFPALTFCKATTVTQVPSQIGGIPVVESTPTDVVPPSTGGGGGGGGTAPLTGGVGAPSASCRYGSTQARVQKDITDPWKPTLTADCGSATFTTFNVGSFHNETGQFANDTRMVVTGPNKFSKLFTNGQAVTATISGTYRLMVTTPGQSGGGCTQQASATVINCPTPTPTPTPSSGRCSTSPIRYPVEGVGWCDATGVRCRYINGKVTQLPDPWCDLEGVPASTCTGPDQRTNTTIQCTRPAGTSCGDATCQAPVENWETCAVDCPFAE